MRRELSAQVAERVMGFVWMRYHEADYVGPDGPTTAFLVGGEDLKHFQEGGDYVPDTGECERLTSGWTPDFATDIAAAMKVVEMMRSSGYRVKIRDYEGGVPWDVTFYNDTHSFGCAGTTLAEAICRAAVASDITGSAASASAVVPGHCGPASGYKS